jgi:hypothetical protein
MNSWNQLVNSALLGTEKMPLQEHLLPTIIKNKLKNANQNDREGLFLQAVSLLWTYNRAGKESEDLNLIQIENAPEESLEVCPSEAQSVFKKMIENENAKVALLEVFLDKMVEKQWIISPNLLRSLLDEGVKIKDKKLRNKISQVIGERGKWLLQFNEAWQYIHPVSAEELWQEGKTSERVEALTEIRQKEPQKAIEMLKITWENESARERKSTCLLLMSLSFKPFMMIF